MVESNAVIFQTRAWYRTLNRYNQPIMFGSFKPAPLQRHDIWISLVCGLVFAGLSAWIVAPQIMFTETLEPFISPNFGEYCEILGLWEYQGDNLRLQPLRRSMLASIPTQTFVAAVGVIDGLGIGALVCAVAVGTGIYIWAGALGGRMAGLFAVTAALSTGVLPLMTRHFTFYPAIIACFVFGAATCAWASRSENRLLPIAIFIGSASAAACLLVDVRGLIWGAPMLLLLVILALAEGNWKRKVVCLSLVIAPLWASHGAGEWNSGGMRIVSLEEQVDVRPLAYLHGARGPGMAPPYRYESQFFWGVSAVAELPKTISFLTNQLFNTDVQSLQKVRGLETTLFDSKVIPWERGAVVALLIVLLGMRSDPKGLMALALTGVPFAAAQMGIHAHHEVRIRFLLQTLPLLCVLYGLAGSHVLTWLLQAVGHTADTLRAHEARIAPRRSALWPAMGGFIVLACTVNIAGWIPGPLHMNANWRGGPWHFVNGHIALYKMMVEEQRGEDVLGTDPWANNGGVENRWTFREQTCDPLLARDRERKGSAFASRLYDQLPQSEERQVRPATGLAPNMSRQRTQ